MRFCKAHLTMMKRYGFENAKPIFVPDRKEYGSFTYTSMVRQPNA